MKLKVKKLNEKAVLPSYSKEGDAAMDFVATSKEICNGFIEYGTGIAMEIPHGYVGLIFPRSSITKKKLILKNSVGVIDSGYRGEIKFRFYRLHDNEYNSSFNVYYVGDRIGQIMIIPIPKIEIEEVEDLSNTDRGEGGYGSTGN